MMLYLKISLSDFLTVFATRTRVSVLNMYQHHFTFNQTAKGLKVLDATAAVHYPFLSFHVVQYCERNFYLHAFYFLAIARDVWNMYWNLIAVQGFFFTRRPGNLLVIAFITATFTSTILAKYWPLPELKSIRFVSRYLLVNALNFIVV